MIDSPSRKKINEKGARGADQKISGGRVRPRSSQMDLNENQNECYGQVDETKREIPLFQDGYPEQDESGYSNQTNNINQYDPESGLKIMIFPHPSGNHSLQHPLCIMNRWSHSPALHSWPDKEGFPFNGMTKENLLPFPSPPLSAQILPPCNSTNCRVNDNPNPVP